MLEVIPYSEDNHWGKVVSWWFAAGQPNPERAALPENSTFVLTVNGKPSACITAYLTNSLEFAILDNLVASSELKKGPARKLAIEYLIRVAEEAVKKAGYRKILCMASNPALARRYGELGYKVTLENISTMIKVLPELKGEK